MTFPAPINDTEWKAMSEARRHLVNEHYASRLRQAGYIVIAPSYIVIAPSERKTRRIGPLVITTDPVGISIRWQR